MIKMRGAGNKSDSERWPFVSSTTTTHLADTIRMASWLFLDGASSPATSKKRPHVPTASICVFVSSGNFAPFKDAFRDHMTEPLAAPGKRKRWAAKHDSRFQEKIVYIVHLLQINLLGSSGSRKAEYRFQSRGGLAGSAMGESLSRFRSSELR